MLAPEILHKIFSNLSYSEVYRIRSVCKLWRQLCEYHLYLSFKSDRQKIRVKIGEKGRTGLVSLEPYCYHPESQVIEFKVLEEDNDDVFMDIKNSSRKMQILFSEWCERSVFNSNLIHSLDLAERAQVLFHLSYNPSLEQVYEIPLHSEKDSHEHYIGDKGVIMAYSYIFSDDNDKPVVDRAINFRGIEDPVITSSFQTLFDEVLVNRPVNKQVVRLRIRSVHATLSWLLSGINPDIAPQSIYIRRYQKLAGVLSAAGVHSNVCAYSEPVLKYIMQANCILSLDDIDAITQSDGYSRREQLRFKLRSLGVDPRSIWKYNLAKTFILTNENKRSIDDVAKVIQKSEEEWIVKKLALLRQLRN